MHYTYLILLPDFLQVLYSTRKFPTKDYYFSKCIKLSTVYLILEQNLNTRNYPRHGLIMEIFILATDRGMNMHAKIQSMNMPYISRKILFGFNLSNFVQCSIEQQRVKLISMCRAVLMEYRKICLIFF
jgi:hypothetical protein